MLMPVDFPNVLMIAGYGEIEERDSTEPANWVRYSVLIIPAPVDLGRQRKSLIENGHLTSQDSFRDVPETCGVRRVPQRRRDNQRIRQWERVQFAFEPRGRKNAIPGTCGLLMHSKSKLADGTLPHDDGGRCGAIEPKVA